MIPFTVSYIIVLVAWWMLSTQFRQILYREWIKKPENLVEALTGVAKHLLAQLSPQNVVAQSFVDGELKILDQRRYFMLLSFQKMALILAGLVLLSTLQLEVFAGLIIIATLLLMVFFKKPVKWIQVALLACVFFMVYQWCFYKASQWIYSNEISDFVFILGDTQIETALTILVLSLAITFLVKFEFWSLWLSSVVFFAGGISATNAMALLIGEALGWSLYWFWCARNSSRKNKIIYREIFFLYFIGAFVYLLFLGWLKFSGFLDIRVMSPLTDKKLIFVAVWALWEILVSLELMVWGHFRSRSSLQDSTEFQSILIPHSIFKRNWLPAQMAFRRQEVSRRLESLRSSQIEMENHLPSNLKKKTQVEVESLQGLLGAIKSD